MGAIDFPSNPTDQQVFSSGGVNYIYNASIGAWLTSYVSTPLYTSANTQVLYNDDGQSVGNTGLVFNRRANTLIVNNLVAAGSNVADVLRTSYNTVNSAFGRANTALQNTSGTFSGNLATTGNITPSLDNSYNLGSASFRWANIYTGDAHFSNEGSEGNIVDGTTGSWTLQEGENDIFIINNKTNKCYKFKLEEV
jgi:hypothetical protein